MKPDTRTLSVIIPVKNNREAALQSYRSLAGLLGDQVELIVQDYKGLSGLREVISDPNVVLLEEEDNGTSAACNLAARHANGKYMIFWGAGELAVQPGFGNAVESLRANPVDILFNCMQISAANIIGRPAPENIEKDMQCLMPADMISKELFFRCGALDTRYMIANDYALFVHMLKATRNYVVSDNVVVDFPLGGQSSMARALEGYIECELIRMRDYNKHPIMAAMDLITTCNNYIRQHTKIQS